MKVEEIAEAVAKLPPDQLTRFRRWFTAFEAGRTDHAEELDSTATRLGRLIPMRIVATAIRTKSLLARFALNATSACLAAKLSYRLVTVRLERSVVGSFPISF